MNATPPKMSGFFQSFQRFFEGLEVSSGIRFCFRDFARVSRMLLPRDRYNHTCNYCIWVKSNEHRFSKCWMQDFILLYTQAGQANAPYLRYCHAGVCEAIVPIKDAQTKELLGVILCGQAATSRSRLLSSDQRVTGSLARTTEAKLMAIAQVVDEYCRATLSVSSAIAEAQRLHTGVNEKVSRAIAILGESFREPLTLGEVARRISLSPSRFAHLLKASTGKGFTEWLRSMRMKEAERLLIFTDIRICDVAEQVGFEDVTYFHRLFKREYKQTPFDYRQQMRTSSFNS